MNSSSCLTPADVERLERGELASAEARRLNQHLESCPTCQRAVEELRTRENSFSLRQSDLANATVPILIRSESASSPDKNLPPHLPKIDGYRITGVLGQGGMGIVYRAVQTKLNRAVALKVLPAMVGSANPSAVKRFRQEATSAARLHHTHIVPIYDFGESHDAYYYAMELIVGQPLNMLILRFAEQNISTASPARLAELIQRGTADTPDASSSSDAGVLPEGSSEASPGSRTSITRGRAYFQHVAHWVADAADALHYAHSQGIIHRDIKPGNLILASDGRIMIADFGLAKVSEVESVTLTGSLLGTVRYLSPEQAMAKRVRVDHRTDIYSLGATMYELLCFQPAFSGSDEKQILASIITRDPPPPRKINSLVPDELETICLKTLEKDPDARYSTARTLAEDLRRYLNDLPIAARRPSAIVRGVKFVRRHKAPVTAIAAALLLLVAGGFWLQASRRAAAAEIGDYFAGGLRFLNAALATGSTEDWAAAERHFAEVLRLDPNHVLALGDLALVKRGLYNSAPTPEPHLLVEAVTLATRAIKISPNDAECRNVMGGLLKMQGKYDDAADSYQEALRLDDKNPRIWANMAVVNVLRGQLSAAEEGMLRAAKLAETVDSPFCEAWRDLTTVQLLRGKVEAAETIDRALKCENLDPWAHLIRARLLLNREGPMDKENALFDIKMADEVYKAQHPVIKRFLALALFRNGKYEAAIAQAQTAIRLKDMPCPNLLVVAIAEGRSGRIDAAKVAYDQAVHSWPQDLVDPGAYRASAAKGLLWFERADELLDLREEAMVATR